MRAASGGSCLHNGLLGGILAREWRVFPAASYDNYGIIYIFLAVSLQYKQHLQPLNSWSTATRRLRLPSGHLGSQTSRSSCASCYGRSSTTSSTTTFHYCISYIYRSFEHLSRPRVITIFGGAAACSPPVPRRCVPRPRTREPRTGLQPGLPGTGRYRVCGSGSPTTTGRELAAASSGRAPLRE